MQCDITIKSRLTLASKVHSRKLVSNLIGTSRITAVFLKCKLYKLSNNSSNKITLMFGRIFALIFFRWYFSRPFIQIKSNSKYEDTVAIVRIMHTAVALISLVQFYMGILQINSLKNIIAMKSWNNLNSSNSILFDPKICGHYFALACF